MKYAIIALFVIFAITQILDLWTTDQVLARGGRELNTLVEKLMFAIGVIPALLIVKGAGVVLMAGLLLGFRHYHMDLRPLLGLLIAANCYYAWVVWHNFGELKSMKARGL